MAAISVVRSMLDHHLAHGTTPADWNWPNVPFATNLKNDPEYGKNIHGMPADFFGGIEPDKRIAGPIGPGSTGGFNVGRFGRMLTSRQAFASYAQKYTAEGDVRVGAVLPPRGVTLYAVPREYHVRPGYRYAIVNDRPARFWVKRAHVGPDGMKLDPDFEVDLNGFKTGPARGHDMLLY